MLLLTVMFHPLLQPFYSLLPANVVWLENNLSGQTDSFSDRSVLCAGSPHGETFVLPAWRMWASMAGAWQLLQQPELCLKQTLKLQLLKINWWWGGSKRNKWELLTILFSWLYSLPIALHLLHYLPWESQRRITVGLCSSSGTKMRHGMDTEVHINIWGN